MGGRELGGGVVGVDISKKEVAHAQVSEKSRSRSRFERLPVTPDGSRWLLLIQTHAVCGSRWLPMAPNDSHRVSLLLNHYPEGYQLWSSVSSSSSGSTCTVAIGP